MAETKVRDAIKGKLNIEVDIDRAHCVERRKSEGINEHQAGAKPRVIVCRLVVSAVVKKARKEKPEELFVKISRKRRLKRGNLIWRSLRQPNRQENQHILS